MHGECFLDTLVRMNTPAITQLDNAALEQLLETEGDALQVIDVRTHDEHLHLGHIPSAKLFPLHLLHETAPTLDKERKTVLVCEHGVRSMDASLYLCHLGFNQVYNLTYGMAAWSGPRVYPRYAEQS